MFFDLPSLWPGYSEYGEGIYSLQPMRSWFQDRQAALKPEGSLQLHGVRRSFMKPWCIIESSHSIERILGVVLLENCFQRQTMSVHSTAPRNEQRPFFVIKYCSSAIWHLFMFLFLWERCNLVPLPNRSVGVPSCMAELCQEFLPGFTSAWGPLRGLVQKPGCPDVGQAWYVRVLDLTKYRSLSLSL